MTCRECGNSKKGSGNGIYCLMFGIMMRDGHEGCKYFTGKEEGNDTTERWYRVDDSKTRKRR